MKKIILSADQIKNLYFYFNFEEGEKITSAELDFEAQQIKIHLIDSDEKENVYIPSLDSDKYYEILEVFQKAEAIKRLELLKLHPNVLNEFKKKGTIYYSERQNKVFDGILYWVSNEKEYEQVIKEFEKTRHALVYHAQLTRFNFGLCLSLLFISQYPEEWEQDREDLMPDSNGIMYPYAYAYNLDIPDYSDLGRIGIIKKNGGISRVY